MAIHRDLGMSSDFVFFFSSSAPHIQTVIIPAGSPALLTNGFRRFNNENVEYFFKSVYYTVPFVVFIHFNYLIIYLFLIIIVKDDGDLVSCFAFTFQCSVTFTYNHWYIVRFPMGLDYLFIIFLLHCMEFYVAH